MKNKNICCSIAAMIVVVICLIIAAFFIQKAKNEVDEYVEGDSVYEQMADMAIDSSKKDIEKSVEEGDSFEEADVTENNLTNSKASCETLCVDFEKLKSINSDVVAWIYSPNTVINYPVVQTKDNSYYLTHLMDGTVNKNGCLFIECKNKNPFLDDNTIIYGHNMASGKMFAELLNYRSQDYYNGHKFIYLITEEVTYKLELFTSFTTDPGSDAYTISLGDKNNFASWLRKMAENADFKTKMKINTNDRIVTLSTCSYSRKNARYVVMGRLVELED